MAEDLLTPPEIMAALIEGTPPLADTVRAMIEPVRRERDAIRSHLIDRGWIISLGEEGSWSSVSATDGAYITSPMVIGDHLSTLAVAVAEDATGAIAVHGHRAWSDFRTHDSDVDLLAQAVMSLHEQVLLSALPTDDIKIIDGSYATPLISVSLALASPDERVRAQVGALARAEGLVEAVEFIARSETVIACPKADSSTDVWDQIAEPLALYGDPMTDKALATLVLDSYEALISTRPTPSWARLYATQARVDDPLSKMLTDRLASAVAPLNTDRVTVQHIKPPDALSVVRIESHPDLTEDTRLDTARAVSASVVAPFTQEPLPQYLADALAKNVTITADVQMEDLRLSLVESGDDAYLNYLTRYRTL